MVLVWKERAECRCESRASLILVDTCDVNWMSVEY